MGKSKKSTPKVEAVAAPVAVSEPPKTKKGKREAEETVEKVVSTKKQKVVKDGVITAKKVTETKTQVKKKKQESSSSSSESDDEPKVKPTTKKGVAPLKAQLSSSSDDSEDEPVAKTTASQSKQAPPKKTPAKGGKKDSSSDSSESESDDSDAKVKTQVKKPTGSVMKNGSLKKDSSSDDSESDSDTSSEVVKKKVVPQSKNAPAAAKNGSVVAAKKVESSSSDSSDSDERDSEEKMEVDKKKVGAEKTSKKDDDSDENSESESSDDEDNKNPTANALKAQPQRKQAENESESDSEEESESDSDEDSDKPTGLLKRPASAVTKGKTETVKDDSSEEESSDESDDEPEPKKKKTADLSTGKLTSTKKDDSTDSSDSDSDSDDEPSKPQQPIKAVDGKTTVKPSTEDSSDEDDSSEESSEDEKSNVQKPTKKPQESDSDEDEDSEDEPSSKAPKKKDMDVEMVDAAKPGEAGSQLSDKKDPKTPAKTESQSSGSKTLFVGNLPFDANAEDLEHFFKEVAEVQEIRLSRDYEGNFKGYGHIEFTSAEGAKKAFELKGEDFNGRPLKLDFARERGAYTPQSKSGGEGQTIFVRGFDKSLGEEEIRNALQEHFGSCGEVTRISVPTDRESGYVKGIAYLDFKDISSVDSAVKLNGSELGGYSLFVDQAKPRGDVSGDKSWGRSDSGDRFGDRRGWGGRGDRGRGGRGDRGDRGRGRGDRGRGRGDRGRGRGTPNRISFNGTGQGKKTTFDDDE